MSAAEQIDDESESKPISQSTYLQALALFTLARHYMLKNLEIEDELGRLLGYEIDPEMPEWGHYAGLIADGVHDRHADFDTLLQQEGFVVEKKP